MLYRLDLKELSNLYTLESIASIALGLSLIYTVNTLFFFVCIHKDSGIYQISILYVRQSMRPTHSLEL